MLGRLAGLRRCVVGWGAGGRDIGLERYTLLYVYVVYLRVRPGRQLRWDGCLLSGWRTRRGRTSFKPCGGANGGLLCGTRPGHGGEDTVPGMLLGFMRLRAADRDFVG